MFYPFSLSIESQGPKASPSLTSAVAVVMLGTFSAPRLAPAALGQQFFVVPLIK